MKKLVLIIGLVAFIGSFVAPTSSFANEIGKVQVDKKKCEKCGSEECEGNCSAKAHKCTHNDTKAHKCTHNTETSKCSHATTPKCCNKTKTKTDKK